MLATVVVLRVGKALRVITFPEFDGSIPKKVKSGSSLNFCMLSRVSHPQRTHVYSRTTVQVLYLLTWEKIPTWDCKTVLLCNVLFTSCLFNI